MACCLQVDENFKRTTTKKKTDKKKFESLLSELKKVKIPAVPEVEDICDGGFTELEIENCGGKAHYRWWTGTTLGWGELDQLVGLFIELSGLIKQRDR